jgi:NADH-quinone oxidoreductase subunit M
MATHLNLILFIGVTTAIYAFSVALVQVDLKKIVAYSSIGHMAFVLVGLFSFTAEGVEGGMLMMLTHGLVSGGLFTVVGFLYDRYKTRNIAAYGGLAQVSPLFATFTFLLIMGNVSFPRNRCVCC